MNERVLREWTIEMFWKCRHCGTENPGLSGSEDESLKCSHCGAQKSDEPWIMPKDVATAESVSDAKQLSYAAGGANWRCAFCENEERTLHDRCSVCGAERDKKAPRKEPVSVHEPATQASAAPPPTLWDQLPDRETVFGLTLFLALFGGAIAAVVGLLMFLFGKQELVARVSSVAWERSERVERRSIVSGTGWRSEAPSSSFNFSCESRQHGTENCRPRSCNCRAVSYECNCTGGGSYECNCHSRTECSSNSNGSASCREVQSCSTCTSPRRCETCSRQECSTCYEQCPVYADYCSYQYERWDELNRRTSRGTDNRPVWTGLTASGADERLSREESYTVNLSSKDDHYTIHPSQAAEFSRYVPGSTWRGEYRRVSGLRILAPAQ